LARSARSSIRSACRSPALNDVLEVGLGLLEIVFFEVRRIGGLVHLHLHLGRRGVSVGVDGILGRGGKGP
jgi:hypothetical protein